MRPSERVRRAPIVTFAVVEVVALFTWLIIGRSTWFYIDEWDFVAARKAGDMGDLFRAHNGHWTTVPVLVFRFLYWAFALRVYLPYRIMIVVLYLTAAALMLVLMRRIGVHPWIATAAASFFALFGAGWENIILPFQITFMGSFTFGLVYLLLVDHDGKFDRRDWFGLLAGLIALMCSAVGLVMVAVVGATVLIRRGRDIALRHVVAMAACYVTWYVTIGYKDNPVSHIDWAAVTRFAWTGLRTAFGALGPVPAFGVVFAFVLVAGLALAARDRAGGPSELAIPVALLGGALVLLVLTAVNGFGFGQDWARQSRYVSLMGVMSLPALAVAADAIARRWRWFLPLAIALFLVGIPTNINAARHAQTMLRARDSATRSIMLTLPHDPLARTVPRSVVPEPTTAGSVTIGWLLDAERERKLPAAEPLTAPVRSSDRFRLSFLTVRKPAPTTHCRSTTNGIVIDLRKGDQIGFFNDLAFLEPSRAGLIGPLFLAVPAADQEIELLHDAGPTRVAPAKGHTVRVCVDAR